jgi:hypothetical protein
MTPSPLIEQINSLPGLIATTVTTGHVESAYAACHENMRSFHDRNGLHSIEYRQFAAALVETGRDSVVEHFLASRKGDTPYSWCVQIDADAVFDPDAVVRILDTAFNKVPDSDMVGAYCQMKGSFAASLDCGSGTWEVHFPGEGVVPVIRTGAHFILTKRSAFEKMGRGPWFRTRQAPRALDIMAELDGYARQNFSGSNPFSKSSEWQELLEKAAQNCTGGPSSVGEDSGFCDRLTAAGGRLYVDCDIVTGHVFRDVIRPQMLKDKVDRHNRMFRLACGVFE